MGWSDDAHEDREFFKVCNLDQLQEGRGRVVFAGTTRVALFKVGPDLHAIKNACPHAGASLGVGQLSGLVVTCPRHDWTFNVATGACLNRKMYSIESFPVEVRGQEVWVGVRRG